MVILKNSLRRCQYTCINNVAGEGMFKIYGKHFSIVIEKVWWWKFSMNNSFLQVSVEALISVSGKVYYSSKTKKIFLTRFSKRTTTIKDCHQNFEYMKWNITLTSRVQFEFPKSLAKMFLDNLTSWWFDDLSLFRPMPPDRLVVVDSETQEIAWRRSQVSF